MHEELVDKKRWISENRFLHTLNYCMLLPGPEAQQLAIYIGWLLNLGRRAALRRGGPVRASRLLPDARPLMGVRRSRRHRLGRRHLLRAAGGGRGHRCSPRGDPGRLESPEETHGSATRSVASRFVSLFFVKVPVPGIVILVAGLIGWIGGRIGPASFPATIEAAASDDDSALIADHHDAVGDRSIWRTLHVLAVGLTVWWGPLLVVMLLRGTDDTLSKEAVFFGQGRARDLRRARMRCSPTSSKPRFRAWVARSGSDGDGARPRGVDARPAHPCRGVRRLLGRLPLSRRPLPCRCGHPRQASVTVWATFAPCFLSISFGAPYIEQLAAIVRSTPRSAQSGGGRRGHHEPRSDVCDCGVVHRGKAGRPARLHGSVPQLDSFDAFTFAIVVVAFAGLWRYRWNVLWVIGGSTLAGLIHTSSE